ncbi:hypothetical protein TOPH_06339 [Tolypocladium ophioglossoides CBS 100239]|uniref:CFEM domain-containing protein n=1 Tax=Tolypocladium ophioglossoides (strain CBS 100239) TaxID=1163406 RepID=A0A0L0N4V2_TOLOC|nr:hypothetical protein TOPH_06339 [Tolypocladium ophioglossoides CBS 100239]
MAQEPSLNSAESKLPKCASSCLGEVIGRTECSATNQTCICTDQTLQQLMTTCLLGSCTIKEALLTKNLTATTCNEPIRDKSPEYVAISNAFGIISALFIVQRFGYKIWAKLDFGPDDWFTLITVISGVPNTVFNAHGVAPNGMGRDAWTLTYDQITNFGRYFYIMEIVYFAEVALLKLTLLFFYVRIFPSPRVRRLLWGTIVFVCLFGVTFVFAATFQCTPIAYYWVRWDREHEGKCLDINAIGWSNAAISIAVDSWMLAIPLWQLTSLRLDWRKKVGVAVMFCTGTFVTVVSILRLRSLVKFGSDTPNPTWDFFDVGIWSTVEINVGIICVCLPSLRLLLVRLFPCLLGTTQRYYTRYASGANRSTGWQSRPFGGTGTTWHVERSQHRPEIQSNHITYQKTYAVEHGDRDNDEVQLVHMPVMDMKSARSDGS